MATVSAVSAAPIDGVLYEPPTRQRVDSIDLLRGLVMVIMMLDHTRDFMSAAAFQFDPTDLSRTTVAIFFTRWITHFCAPVFFFLAGTGAYLRRARGATPGEMSRFLVSRGLWLIALELTVVRIGLFFDFNVDQSIYGLTIWALGWSMIVLAVLVHAPLWFTTSFGIVMIAVHNAFDGMRVPEWQPGTPDTLAVAQKIAMVLHQPGVFSLGGGHGPVFVPLYSLIPWMGVMAAGYGFGRLYTLDAATRRRALLRIGGAVVALFVVLRFSNLYGDHSKWSVQSRPVFTLLSFLDTAKYPPSLLYLCMTLGPAILLLAMLERERRGPIGDALVTFGRVPMLFYLLQWYVAHLLALGAYTAFGKPTDVLFGDPTQPRSAALAAKSGFSLPVVYLSWITGVLIIYPICKRYAAFKARRREWWLGYL